MEFELAEEHRGGVLLVDVGEEILGEPGQGEVGGPMKRRPGTLDCSIIDAVNAGVKWLWATKQNVAILAKYGIKDPDYLTPPAKNPRLGVDRDDADNVIGKGAHKAKVIRDYCVKHGLALDKSHAYTDSMSDYPMLAIVGRPTAVNPDLRLRTTARSYEWPILDIR